MSPQAALRLCGHPGCGVLVPRGRCAAHQRDHDKARGQTGSARLKTEPWRRLYMTARWKELRLRFLAAHPLCQCENCNGYTTVATVVDHIEPHRGDVTKFYDWTNLAAMAKRCHDRKTAGETLRHARVPRMR